MNADLSRRVAALLILLWVSSQSSPANTYTVNTATGNGNGSLVDAVNQANAGKFDTINISDKIGTIQLTQQLVINSNVTINGNAATIDMNGNDRAFFVLGGTVNINNLTIKNGLAKGGDGGPGAGAGAGLGGAIFVANGNGIVASGAIAPTNVTLSGITFSENTAKGGDSVRFHVDSDKTNGSGGGGGLGGAGGGGRGLPAGGGGGLGLTATGGNPEGGSGGNGFLPNTPGGGAGNSGGGGGGNGGGGGAGGYPSKGLPIPGGGGGGGIGGQSSAGVGGGNAGWGGGGGGGTDGEGQNKTKFFGNGGDGNFGGGGGAAQVHKSTGIGGNGGFGASGGLGGGAKGNSGFGAGSGNISDDQKHGAAGGGLGAGGAIFVQKGANLTILDSSFSGNTVTAGHSDGLHWIAPTDEDGMATGKTVFLGETTTFGVSGTNTIVVADDVGGAAADPRHQNDPNAQGGIIKVGTGTLDLRGINTYTGVTLIKEGTIAIGSNQALGKGAVTVNGTNVGLAASDPTIDPTIKPPYFGTPPPFVVANSITLTPGSSLNLKSDKSNTVFFTGPELILNGAITGASGTSITKIGAGAVQIQSPGPSQFAGNFAVNEGAVIINATDFKQLNQLTVATSAELDLSFSNVTTGSLTGGGTINLTDQVNLVSTTANGFSGAINVNTSDTTNLTLPGGGGSITMAPGTSVLFDGSQYSGKLSGSGTMTLQIASASQNVSFADGGFSGILQNQNANLVLPTGLSQAASKIILGNNGTASLQTGGSIAGSISGTNKLITIATARPTDAVELTGDLTKLVKPLFFVQQGTFVLPYNRSWNGSAMTLRGTANISGKVDEMIFSGNGTLNFNAATPTTAFNTLAFDSSGLFGTLHLQQGILNLLNKPSGASQILIDSNGTLNLGASISGKLTGKGTLNALTNQTVEIRGDTSGFDGKLNLAPGSAVTLNQGFSSAQTSIQIAATSSLTSGGDLNGTVTGAGRLTASPATNTAVTFKQLGGFNGTLVANQGTLNLPGGNSSIGALQVNQGATLQTDGSLAGALTGLGTLKIQTLLPSDRVALTGSTVEVANLNLDRGTLSINPSQPIKSALTLGQDGTFLAAQNFQTGSLSGAGEFRVVPAAPGTQLSIAAGVDVSKFTGLLNVQNGTLSLATPQANWTGPVQVAGGASIISNASQTFTSSFSGDGTLRTQQANSVTILAGETTGFTGTAQVANNSTLIAFQGLKNATVSLNGSGATLQTGGNLGGRLSGNGVIQIQAPTQTTEITLEGNRDAFTGSVNLTSGTLLLPNGDTHFTGLAIGGSSTVKSGGDISGAVTGLGTLKIANLTGDPNPKEVTLAKLAAFQGVLNLSKRTVLLPAGAPNLRTLIIDNDSLLTVSGDLGGTLTSTGTLRIETPGTVNFTGNTTVTGLLDVASGTFNVATVSGNPTSWGRANIQSGGTLSISSTATIGLLGNSLKGSGSLVVASSPSTRPITLNLGSDSRDFTGSVSIGTGSTLQLQKPLLNVSSTRLNGTLVAGAQLGGRLVGNGTFQVTTFDQVTWRKEFDTFAGNVLIDQGTLQVDARPENVSGFQVGTNGILSASTSIAKLINGSGQLIVRGTDRLGLGVPINTPGESSFTGMTLNLGKAKVDLYSENPIAAQAVLLNQNGEAKSGTGFIVNPGAIIQADGESVVKGGAVFVNGGTLQGPRPGKGIFANQQFLVFEREVSGAGTFTGNIKYNGGFNPSGPNRGGSPTEYSISSFDGNLSFGKDSTQIIDIGGRTRGTKYDALDVASTLRFDGALLLKLRDNFTPGLNDEFLLARADAFQGQFKSFEFADAPLPKGLTWDTSSLARTGVLALTPDPKQEFVIRGGRITAILQDRIIEAPTRVAGNFTVVTPSPEIVDGAIGFPHSVIFKNRVQIEGSKTIRLGSLVFGGDLLGDAGEKLVFRAKEGTQSRVFFGKNTLKAFDSKLVIDSGVSAYLGGRTVALNGPVEVREGAGLFLGTTSVFGFSYVDNLTDLSRDPKQLGTVAPADFHVDGFLRFNRQEFSRLTGSGAVEGIVINRGLVAPGNSVGALVVGGNYRQTQAAELEIEIDSAESLDQLSITGKATLKGGLRLKIADDLPLKFGDRFKFMTAEAGITGELTEIEANTPYAFQVRSNSRGTALFAVAGRGSYTGAAETTNQKSLALALQTLRNSGASEDFEEISDVLDFLPTRSLRSALDSLTPTTAFAASQTTLSLSNTQLSQVENRLIGLGGLLALESVTAGPDFKLMAEEESRWSSFMEGSGLFARIPNVGNASSFDYTTGAATVGVDYAIHSSLRLGLYAGYAGTDAELGGGSDLELDSARFGLFGVWSPIPRLSLYGSVGGAWHGYENSRRIVLPGVDRTATSDPDGLEFNTLAGVGYDIERGDLTFGPFASLQYTHVTIDGATESGAGSLNLKYKEQQSDSLRSNLGIKTAYAWAVAPGITLTPSARVAWQHEYLGSPENLTANLNSGAGPGFSVESSTTSADSLLLSVGATLNLNQTWNISAYYTGNYTFEEGNVNAVQASVGFEF